MTNVTLLESRPAPVEKAAYERKPPLPAPSFSVVVVHTEQELTPYLQAWDDLARDALEPNVFYESWMMLPALRSFGTSCRLQFVIVLQTSPDGAAARMCGFFPLERRPACKGLPVSCLCLWRHLYCFLGVPLLRASCARACLDAFFEWLAHDPQGAPLMEWPWFCGDGPICKLLAEHTLAHYQLSEVTEEFTRGLLRPCLDAEAYLRSALSSRQRKELRRKEKTLAALGCAEQRLLSPDENVQPWIEAFLRLEASGWKGRQGTALAARDVDRDYFRTIATEAFRRGQMMMLGLFLNDRPIALKCNFLAGAGSFAFKIAFDEALGSVSPGYQLEIANIHALHGRPELQWMDSCTSCGPSMFDQLWMDRHVVQTWLVSSGRLSGNLAMTMLPFLRWLKRGPARLRAFLSRPTPSFAPSIPVKCS